MRLESWLVFAVGLVACKSSREDSARAAAPAPASATAPAPASAPAPTPDAATTPANGPFAVLARLREFRHKVELDRGAYEALASNMSSHMSSLRKYKNIFDWEGVIVRIPEAPWIDVLSRDLNDALAKIGLTNIDVRATDRPIQRRKLPDTGPEGPGFVFEDDDIRGIIDVQVTADGADAARSKKVLDAIHASIRVLAVVAFADKGGRLEATLTAYHFLPVTPPKLAPRPRLFEADMRAAGLDPATVANLPGAKEMVDGIVADYAVMQRRSTEFAEVLSKNSELSLWDAKLRFHRKVTGGGSEQKKKR